MANRVLALLGTLFTLAERWEWRPQGSNPARAVEWFRATRARRFLSDPELARLGDRSPGLEAEDMVQPTAAAALRLLLLTGARRDEVLRLRWCEVDLERGCLRLEDSKTGAKVIPLSQQARALLTSLPRDSKWVFPSPHVDDASVQDLRKPWRRALEHAGLCASGCMTSAYARERGFGGGHLVASDRRNSRPPQHLHDGEVCPSRCGSCTRGRGPGGRQAQCGA